MDTIFFGFTALSLILLAPPDKTTLGTAAKRAGAQNQKKGSDHLFRRFSDLSRYCLQAVLSVKVAIRPTAMLSTAAF